MQETLLEWSPRSTSSEKLFLLMDRDTRFSEAFRFVIEQAGVKALRLPPRSPNLNPNLERFMRSIKEECLERIIFFGEKSLRNDVADFLAHYHQERNHQGSNQLIQPGNDVVRSTGDVAFGNDLVGCCAITSDNKLPDVPIQMAAGNVFCELPRTDLLFMRTVSAVFLDQRVCTAKSLRPVGMIVLSRSEEP